MSVRVPSSLITPMPRSVTYATAFPSPVQRVPNGREVFAASVVSERGWEPSRLEAQRTNAPEGLCRQYASRPVVESAWSVPVPELALGTESASTVA
jgi:hypothetical protein